MGEADPAPREVWLAPAKVNLWLSVGPLRADGLHDLDTCYQAIDLLDRVTVARAPEGMELSCSVSGEFAAGIPDGEENVAARAARLLAARTGHGLRVGIEIEKRIPPGAGLGGGSSDAAAVLLALARRFAVPDPEHTLVDLAAEIGADVPFFFCGGTQRAAGIGDELQAVAAPEERWGILVWPGAVVSTREGYGWLDAERDGATGYPLAPSIGAGRGNDFETVVASRVPEVGIALDALKRGPARHVRMSGSGSASFALYESAELRDGDIGRVRQAIGDLPSARLWPFACVDHGVRPERAARAAR